MGKRPTLTAARIVEIAQSQLPTIARLWDNFVGNTVAFLNALRGLFHLPDQSAAADLYRAAIGYANTSAGQSALGIRPVFSGLDVPLVPDLRSPFGDYGRFRYVVAFEIGGEYFSFVEWRNTPPTTSDLAFSVAEYVAEMVEVYEVLADIMSQFDIADANITVRGAKRRY